MKKMILSIFVILTFLAYAFQERWAGQKNINNNSSNTNFNSLNIPSTSSTTNNANSVKYKDGVYTGNSVDVYYGNVQVKATISGGKITDVQFLNYPQDRQHSNELSMMAMPILKSEAIQAQNAGVDIVSGATQTSDGFQLSLQSALSQAKS
jgi:uncharacterized protein with FMN-binding domain